MKQPAAIDRVSTKTENAEEAGFQTSLRPQTLKEYIGQEAIKNNLLIAIEAARQRKESLDHLLLYGSPGLGKTTLAHITAHEMGKNIVVTSGPALERSGDLAAILTNLQSGDILFIDEIHRLHRTIEEVLYPAMEDFALDLVIGKGPAARTVRLDLPRFTLVGATTRLSLLSSPLRDRFGHVYHLDFYANDEIADIIRRSAQLLGIRIDAVTSQAVAERSRKTPRIANRLLKRVRDYSQVRHAGVLTPAIALEALELLQVDTLGLDQVDRGILRVIIDKFAGGPVGLTTIAAATDQETGTIEDVCEPFLIQAGLLKRTPRGREATRLAYQHLGISR
ncbi:MAG: Holliday junction branch migration DNA helicase RuvB [Parcubacteria group bacterium]|nr:Holliday junction branch migration DNA helicase RuvB [Parcubacteria group bacterium]